MAIGPVPPYTGSAPPQFDLLQPVGSPIIYRTPTALKDSIQLINVGSNPGDQTGDPGRLAWQKANLNFNILSGLTGIPGAIAGTDPTGLYDNATVFGNAVGSMVSVLPGTYIFNTNVTITPNLFFWPGAIFKPANGVTITISSSFQAGVYQIFDLTLGGLVVLPRSCGEVWAEWWGAKGDLVKTNNEVPFNQAWFALLSNANGIANGGAINIDRGDFLKSGSTYHSDMIRFRGHGGFYPLVKANAATWNGDSNMFRAQSSIPVAFTVAPLAAATSGTLTAAYSGITDAAVSILFFAVDGSQCELHAASVTGGGTSVTWTGGLAKNCTVNAVVLTKTAIFYCPYEHLRIDAGDIAAITQVGYFPAFQQQSGFEDCYISNYRTYGCFAEFGYGGSAQGTIRRTQFFTSPSCVAGSAAIKLGGTNGLGGSVGRYKLNLEEVQMASNVAAVTWANPIAPALTFTAAPVATAVSATLNASWTGTTGGYLVWFVETAGGANELRTVTLTNGQTTATWTGGLANNCNATTSAAPSTSLSGALAANWAFPTGAWNVIFSDNEVRSVTLTNGATTATWSTNITSATGVTASASGVSPNSQGLVCSNSRVTVNCENVHLEQLHDGFNLDGNACVVGNAMATDGVSSVTNMFTCQTTWVGSIAVQNAFVCGALNYVNDLGRPSTQPTVDPTNNFLMWPPVTGSPSWMPQVSYDSVNGGWQITNITSVGGLNVIGATNINCFSSFKATNASPAHLWYIGGTLYGRWGADLAGNEITGSGTGDNFIRTANKRFLISTNDGAGIQFQLNGSDIVQTRGVAVCLRATTIETRTSTTTLTNSTQLTYAIPAAGTYEFELTVFNYFTTAVTDGITANVNYSGTFTAVGSYLMGYLTNGTTTTTGIQPVEISATVNNALAGLTLATYGASVAAATPAVYKLKGNLIATGTGTLAFAFAQSTSGVDTANLGVGSYMKVTQLS